MINFKNVVRINSTILLFVFSLLFFACKETGPDPVSDHFESLKQKPEALYSFFEVMPKGGDLHHHASGSPQAESFIRIALTDSLYIDTETYQLTRVPSDNPNTYLINDLLSEFPSERDSIIDAWSVRNYKKHGRNGHDQFFGTFPKFMPAFEGHEGELLSELCKKAAADNISYIETSITVPNVEDSISLLTERLEFRLIDTTAAVRLNLEHWYSYLQERNMAKWAQVYADSMDSYFNATEKHGVALKFQGYGLRILNDPPKAFGHLLLAFMGAEKTENIVGVNFVAPEDNPAALDNYTLHMYMFQFLKEKHPSVNVTLHSGELVLGKGEADAEDLTYHIDEALEIAGAQRIGHGVDIASETDKEEILQYMKDNGISVEINLESNEVILERTPENHPISLYKSNGVPFSISTDDEGVLRTNLTNQYMLLTKYLPDITYSEVKEIVYNSLRYSFLNNSEKQALISDLDDRFAIFEESIISSN